MKGIGFGLDRVALLVFDRPKLAMLIMAVVVALAGFGITKLRFDENLRNLFATDSESFSAYVQATEDFVDPENELLVLVEGGEIADPAVFQRLQDFQFELQLLDGVESVYSLFALREPPAADGSAALLVADTSNGLTPALIQRIRAHPILGDRLVSPDGHMMTFTVTPSEPKAPLSVSRELTKQIQATADDLLGGTHLTVTVTGFSVIRATTADIIKRDQIVLNAVGAVIGTVMSLIVFRSVVASIMAAVPAIVGGLCVVGFMGLFGAKVTVMSTVVPALVMIFGYADGMHLCFSWRRHREAGASVVEAEREAQKELAGACALSAITTSVAFLSLTISSVVLVRGFGMSGAIGTIGGMLIVLLLHGLITRAIGRFWKIDPKRKRSNLLEQMEGPSGAVGRFAVRHARVISSVAVVLLVVLGAAHYSVKPENQIRENLPRNNPANAALGRIDQEFGGVFPLQILVPLHGEAATSPDALARIRAVQEAVGKVDGIGSKPLSMWSLAQWLGGEPDATLSDKLNALLDTLPPSTRTRFVGSSDAAMVMATVPEMPSAEAGALVNRVEAAAKAAGGDDVTVTGVTVVNAREGARTINGLNLSLLLSVVVNLGVIALAFRSLPIGAVSFLPNMLPILAIGAMLYVTGRGMQFTTVIALTVAFGIAVNDAVHFLNRFLHVDGGRSLNDRLIDTSAHIGPVLIGTTLIIIAGISTTQTSGMPTIATFGIIASLTLLVGIIGDVVILPALIAGPGRRWFDRRGATDTEKATST